jgi:hypothetical protein
MSGLTEEEILAIAEYQHVPETVACGMAEYLTRTKKGRVAIGEMIIADVREAQQRGDRARTRELLHVLHHYLKTHPEACPTVQPWSRVVAKPTIQYR